MTGRIGAVLLVLAVFIGEIRLLDNVLIRT